MSKHTLWLIIAIGICSFYSLNAQININDFRAVNAADTLNIPSYHPNLLGQKEVLHPDVLYISGAGLFGFNYWMAYTPYPNTDTAFENPCIAVSTDNVRWIDPGWIDQYGAERTNPIDSFSGAGDSQYNSDPELVLTADSLYCIWRKYVLSPASETLYYLSAPRNAVLQRVQWSAVKTKIIQKKPTTEESLISPAIVYANGLFRMWTMKKPLGTDTLRTVIYREATTLTGLNKVGTATTFNQLVNDLKTPITTFNYLDTALSPAKQVFYQTWHLNVIYHEGYYWMLNQVGKRTGYGGDLFIGYSADGIDWTFGSLPLIRRRDPYGNWDRLLYRSALLPFAASPSKFQIWYSAERKNDTPAKIGYTYAQLVPSVAAATAVCHNGFTARWNAVPGAAYYKLDVLQSDGITYVTGYRDITVTNTLARVENLFASTAYKYRVRAFDSTVSQSSNHHDAVTSYSTAGSSANTSISGDSVVVKVPSVTGGPAFTNNNVTIDPALSSSYDYSVSYTWNPSGYGGLPTARLCCTITCSDNAGLNGRYTLYHSGMGFRPAAAAYRLGTGAWQWVAVAATNDYSLLTISGLSADVKGSLTVALDDGNGTLPVELSSFTAMPTAQNFVRLDWITQSETNVLGYYIYRNLIDNPWSARLCSPLITAANTSHEVSYSFTDREVAGGGIYYYWLQNTDFSGESAMHGPISVTVKQSESPSLPIPLRTGISGIFPNPSGTLATITFELAKAGDVKLEVFDLKGKKICTIYNGKMDRGKYHKLWNGTADDGESLTSGMYIAKLSAENHISARKIILVK